MRALLIVSLIVMLMATQLSNAYAQDEELVVLDGEIRILENRSTILTDDIIVGKNSTLILRNMVLQLSIRGEKNYSVLVDDNSTLILENSNITSLSNASIIRIGNASNFILNSGSSIIGFQTIELHNSYTISFIDSNLYIPLINGSTVEIEIVNTDCDGTTLDIASSKIFMDSSKFSHLSANVIDLEGRSIDAETMSVNCSSADLNGLSSKDVNISAANKALLSNGNIETSWFYSPNNATIADSIFGALTIGLNGRANNVTTSKTPLTRAGGMIYTYNASDIERYWYLKINVTDITGFPIPADIEIYDHDLNLLETVKADETGIYHELTLAEVMVNKTINFVGNYRLRAYFQLTEQRGEEILTLDTISTEGILSLDSNKEVNLIFADVIYGLTATTVSVDPVVSRLGDTVTVSGLIKTQIEGEAIELVYTKPDGSMMSTAAITGLNGTYVSDIKPDMVGRWVVYANWIGGVSYTGEYLTISRKISFYVEEPLAFSALVIRVLPALIVIMAVMIGVAFIFMKKSKAI